MKFGRLIEYNVTAEKMKFSIKNFFSKCDQICSFLSHFLKKSLMENFTFCAVREKYFLLNTM